MKQISKNAESHDYQLDKTIYTEEDIDSLCFHDCPVYAMAPTDGGFALDIDYLFEWYEPDRKNKYFTFQVAPCTLFFRNVGDLGMDFEGTDPETSLIIYEFSEEQDETKYNPNQRMFYLDCLGGRFSLFCDGFDLIVRQKPVFSEGQGISMEQRGGISFSRQPYK